MHRFMKHCAWLTSLAALAASQQVDAEQATASSPRYRIVEGKGYTVCEAFLKNLNALPPDDPPMVCELKIHPTHPEFSRPRWEELDVQGNLPLIYEAESLLWIKTPIGTKPKPFDAWQMQYQERIKVGPAKARLRRTVLDLNGSGPETLVWYELPETESCATSVAELNFMSDLNSFGGHVFLLRNGRKLERLGGMITTGGHTEVLIYRSKTVLFANANAGAEHTPGKATPIWNIGLHPVSPRLSYEGLYVVPGQCRYRTAR